MMPTKALYCLTVALTVLSWTPIGVLGVPVDNNEIQSRDVPTPGQPVSGGDATFFFQGGAAGACGQVHADSDLIAAMATGTFSSSLCGKQVQVTNTQNQKSVTVTIADQCPGCQNPQSIDLSVGAFDAIADEAEGRVPIVWTLQ